MSCPKVKFSMHKAFINVLSLGQVLHAQSIRLWHVIRSLLYAQGIHLCPVLAIVPYTRHLFMSCPKDNFTMNKILMYVLS